MSSRDRASLLARDGARRLARSDAVMAGLVDAYGPPDLSRPLGSAGLDPFAVLVECVLFQQLAGAAAAAIRDRVVAAAGGALLPEPIARLGEERLRAAGASGAKATALVGIAGAVLEGSLDLGRLSSSPDLEVVERLCELRGVGRWTAEMFLIFGLHRPDVWPTTDYGVRQGYALAYGLPELPSPRELDVAGERFRPCRSFAAWYCWRVAEQRRAEQRRAEQRRAEPARGAPAAGRHARLTAAAP